MQYQKRALTAYQTTKTFPSENVTKPTRGVKAPLKAIRNMLGIWMFLSAATTILTLDTFNHFDRTHIAGWTSYRVQPGDTLLGLTERFDPIDDRDRVMTLIEKQNGLDSSTIQSGQVIQVPVVKGDLP